MKTLNQFMKKHNSTIAILLLLSLFGGCKKSVGEPPKPPPPSRLKMGDANADITIQLPSNSIMLNGRIDPNRSNGQITQVKWKRIGGPSTCIIEHAALIQTKVSNLEKGTYQFELSAYDHLANYDMDTMTLKVVDPSGTNRQVIFENIKMTLDGGPLGGYTFVEIENFYEFVPAANPFIVYMKKHSAGNWLQVDPYPQNDPSFSGHAYFIYNNSTFTISDYPDGFSSYGETIDVKIVY